jgi:hypothetical protein
MVEPGKIDWDKIDEAAFAILCLTLHDGRAWKGLDWDILDRLHRRGWILDPRNKAKSVVVTEDGEAMAKRLLEKHFAKKA